jgi:hypothetical protein
MKKETDRKELEDLLKDGLEREAALASAIQSFNGTRNKFSATGMKSRALILELEKERKRQARLWKELEREYSHAKICG